MPVRRDADPSCRCPLPERAGALALGLALLMAFVPASTRAADTLTITEDFSSAAGRDATTTARWSPAEQALVLAFRRARRGAFDPSTVTGTDVTADAQDTAAVALGDVDGDGDLDLVAGNSPDQPNRLYLNNGTGDPFAGVVGTDITTDAQSTSAVALGDVDGDGDLDLVAGNGFGQANRLYLNNGTADPFASVTGSDITADADATFALALDDVDGDGDLDLVAGNAFSQRNRLYLNNGTADPFAGIVGTDITTDAQSTSAVALGDVDGDGDLDLVAGDTDQPNRLYLNNGTNDPFAGVTGADITADAQSTSAVALGDIDGDGDLDLVAGSTFQPNRLYLNNGSADPFAGVTGTDITADAQITTAVALGDIDGDGDLDLVVGNSSQPLRLYVNNGTNDPFAGVTGSDVTADSRPTLAVALGDVDGDGDPDLVAGNFFQPNRLYLNDGTADPFAGVAGTDITSDVHNTFAVALGDVDGDGDLDLVAGNPGFFNNVNQPTSLYLNNGTADPFSGVVGIPVTDPNHFPLALALGDVDGDGNLDLVTGNFDLPIRLYLNNGTADPFDQVDGSHVAFDTQTTPAVALGDVDGDGDLDLVAGSLGQPERLYLNNGTADPFAGVSGANITADGFNTRAVALGDVDGDGDLDLVAGNDGSPNRLYLNNGTTDPFAGVTGANITADADSAFAVALGDIDGDGDLDLVVGNDGSPNRLYLNNGTAAPFDGVTGADITTDARSTFAVALGDFDGDGDLDLATGNFNQPNRLYLNSGTDDPFAGAIGTDITTDTDHTRAVALGDVDGDGDLDFVAGNEVQPNRLYLNGGTADSLGRFTGTDVTADSQVTFAVALGDVDGDGDLDLVAGNLDQPNRLYLSSGTADPFAGISGTEVTADAHSTLAVALGDVDGDGDLDLVAGNHSQRNRCI
ncbi:MAG: VCBS repeat-containing protein [Ectothiorhodospiraceae bacterium]|nr:VCBS repeat-containing protein [Ectothiorhodospiraceae bacterium]